MLQYQPELISPSFMQDSYDKIFKDKQKILVVMAHPDDAEIYAGGTIARLTADGKEVRVVKMTSGNKGSRQEDVSESKLKKVRIEEDANSMKVLGVSRQNTVCLDLGDGEVENDLKTIGLLAKEIRLFKPQLIITHNPEHTVIRFGPGDSWVNHRDHRHTGMSALDAAYPYSRDLLFFPHHFKDPQAASHAVSEFLLVDYWDHPDTVGIGIGKFVAIRNRAIASHKSQYSEEDAKGLTEFMDQISEGTFERFRYVVAD